MKPCGHKVVPVSDFLPLPLPALTDLQRDHSVRQPCLALPQLTPPLPVVPDAHFRDGEMGGLRGVSQRRQGRLLRWDPFHLQVRGQSMAKAASQVELLARY